MGYDEPLSQLPDWPAAFSETFVTQAVALLDHRSALLIVGRPGTNRHDLAEAAGRLGGGEVHLHQCLPGDQHRRGHAFQAVMEAVGIDPVKTPADIAPTIIVRDADLCDEVSLSELFALARTGRVRLIVTLTAETVAMHPEFAAAAGRIDLGPLDFDTVHALLRARFRRDPQPVVVEYLREKSHGAYGVLREISDAAYESGGIRVVEGIMTLDPERTGDARDAIARSMAPRSAARLGGTDEVTDLLDLTALVGELYLTEAHRCVDGADVRRAVRHGALRQIDEAVALMSIGEAELIVAAMPAERRAYLFETYADRVPDSMRRPGSAILSAQWWLAVQRRPPDDLCAVAARQANLAGLHDLAIEFTEPPGGGTVTAPIERIFALTESGDGAGARDLLASIDPDSLSEDDLLLHALWMPPDLSIDRITGDPDESGHDPDAQRRRRAVLALAELCTEAFDHGDDDQVSRLRTLTFSSVLSPLNRAAAFTVLSDVHRHAGRPEQAVGAARAALTILRNEADPVSATRLDPARETHILALISMIDYDGAELALREYAGAGRPHAAGGRLRSVLWAMLDFFRGNISHALAHSRLGAADLQDQDPHHLQAWTEAMLVQTLLQAGRSEEARQLLEASLRRPAPVRRQYALASMVSQACAQDLLGETEEALHLLESVLAESREHQLRLIEIDAAVLLVQIGGPPYLPELLTSVDGLDEASGTPAVWRSFARAASMSDFRALASLAHELEHAGAKVFAAEVAQYALDAGRDAADLTDADRAELRGLAEPRPHRSPAGT